MNNPFPENIYKTLRKIRANPDKNYPKIQHLQELADRMERQNWTRADELRRMLDRVTTCASRTR